MMKKDHAQKKFKIDLIRKGKVTRNVTLEVLCSWFWIAIVHIVDLHISYRVHQKNHHYNRENSA